MTWIWIIIGIKILLLLIGILLHIAQRYEQRARDSFKSSVKQFSDLPDKSKLKTSLLNTENCKL